MENYSQNFKSTLTRIKRVLIELDKLVLSVELNPVKSFKNETDYPRDFQEYMKVFGELTISYYNGALADGRITLLSFEKPKPLLSHLQCDLDVEGFETNLWYLRKQYEAEVDKNTVINSETDLKVSDVMAFGNTGTFEFWSFDIRKKPYTFLLDETKASFADEFRSHIDIEFDSFLNRGSYLAACEYINDGSSAAWDKFVYQVRSQFFSSIFLRLLEQNSDLKFSIEDPDLISKIKFHFTDNEHDNYAKADRWIEVISTVKKQDFESFIMAIITDNLLVHTLKDTTGSKVAIYGYYNWVYLIETRNNNPISIQQLSVDAYDNIVVPLFDTEDSS